MKNSVEGIELYANAVRMRALVIANMADESDGDEGAEFHGWPVWPKVRRGPRPHSG